MTVKRAAKARDYMTRHLITLTPDMEVMHAIGIMVERQISGAPVLDATGNLVGMLSEKDQLAGRPGSCQDSLARHGAAV